MATGAMMQNFGTKRGLLAALTGGWLSIASAADAITYNVDRKIDAGTVTGFVSTDGTLGTLSSINITDWTITLTAPNLAGGSEVITNIRTFLEGTGTTATPTELIFDFSTPLRSYFLLQGPDPFFNFWCLESATGNCSGAGLGEHIGFTNDRGVAQSVTGQEGLVVFATAEAAAVPGPLVGAGLPGLIFAGGALLAWRRRRQAA